MYLVIMEKFQSEIFESTTDEGTNEIGYLADQPLHRKGHILLFSVKSCKTGYI